MDFCEDCEKDVPSVDDSYRCPSCAEKRNERAYEAAMSDFYGGNGPMTLDEQCQAARRLK